MKLVVIGLDSASWNVLMPLIEAGDLPTIERLMTTGVRGYLRSSVPPITFPAWKCYSTGKNPGKLGVYSFTGLDKERKVHQQADCSLLAYWWAIRSTLCTRESLRIQRNLEEYSIYFTV